MITPAPIPFGTGVIFADRDFRDFNDYSAIEANNFQIAYDGYWHVIPVMIKFIRYLCFWGINEEKYPSQIKTMNSEAVGNV